MGERFDEFCEDTTRRFMELPEIHYVDEDNIKHVSTEYMATDIAARNLPWEDKLAILGELADEAYHFHLHTDLLIDDGEVTVGKVLNALLSYLAAPRLRENPLVQERLESNKRTAGED